LRRISLTLSFLLVLLATLPLSGSALIFADEAAEPAESIPPDFPYWDHVTQRRYGGPTVVLLGGGWALTARHVGPGEVEFNGGTIDFDRASPHTLLNPAGSPADAVVYEFVEDPAMLDLLPLPIASEPPREGEEVVMIGFGRLRNEQVDWGPPESRIQGFSWSKEGAKRWGTNRIHSIRQRIRHQRFDTYSMALRFDAPDDPGSTPHEASATLGDSGGALFAKRDRQWQLIGLITSISRPSHTPSDLTVVGDFTYAADLSDYRDEILRWTRPACANEEDDDRDGHIDYPADPDCESRHDRDERYVGPPIRSEVAGAAAGVIVLLCGGLYAVWRRNQRIPRTPDSTSSSSAR
jgi:hypothetical protein